MPKDRRKRTTGHVQSARLDKRQFQTGARPEHVDLGSLQDVSADDILSSMTTPQRNEVTKKQKQQMKHDAFIQRLESSQTPYSKSHAKRMKRKAKEQIAGGLSDVKSALLETGGNAPVLELIGDERRGKNDMDVEEPEANAKRKKTRQGIIGEGRSSTLSDKQRMQVLKTEKIRQPLLLATPEFAHSPFKALRIHAQNTLLKH